MRVFKSAGKANQLINIEVPFSILNNQRISPSKCIPTNTAIFTIINLINAEPFLYWFLMSSINGLLIVQFFVHCEAQALELSVGAEAICPSIRQIASLHCVPLAMTVRRGVSLAMTVKMGRLLRSVALHSQ